MTGKDKYKLILDKINKDEVFSKSYFDYFKANVSDAVSKGRYVILAMYGNDNNAVVDIETLRTQTKEINEPSTNINERKYDDPYRNFSTIKFSPL